jgi:hypothetical protein
MKLKNIITLFLALLCMSFAASPATAQAQPSGPQKFSTMAHLPSGVGRRMVGAGGTFNVDIYIESYSSDEQVKALGAMLVEGGSDAVLKALEKMPSIGKITLTGRLGFYDLKLIRSRQMENGRRIIAVTARPISGLKTFYSARSQDYTYGILELELKPDKKGEREEGTGTLIYAAKVKLIKDNTLEIENFGIDPIQLLGVRELK